MNRFALTSPHGKLAATEFIVSNFENVFTIVHTSAIIELKRTGDVRKHRKEKR